MKNTFKNIVAMAWFGLFCLGISSAESSDQKIDADLTGLSHVLAGIQPQGSAWSEVVVSPEWKEHHDFFKKKWAKYKTNRARPVEAWRHHIPLLKSTTTPNTMHYPFSGPDFLNAYLFFPDADQYVFYSLEPIGVIPDLSTMTALQRGDLFKDIQNSLGDIFKRQFFITKHMNEQFKTPYLKGNTATFLIFLAFHQAKIISLEKVTLNKEGKIVPWAQKPASDGASVPGIKIDFLNASGTKKQELVYFSLDVTDKALEKHPEFMAYLTTLPPSVTFMKAASYLLHSQHFPFIRKTILTVSDVIVQDDSGMPYRFLKPDTWSVKIFGRYKEPVKDFNYGYQKDLDDLYKTTTVPVLPFKFGYHWWDEYSNLLIAEKKKSEELKN